jgi:hypothetical protein
MSVLELELEIARQQCPVLDHPDYNGFVSECRVWTDNE